MAKRRDMPGDRDAAAPILLEPGPWWTGRRLRPKATSPAARRLPLWARVGVGSPMRTELVLSLLAVVAAAVGGGLLLAAALVGEAR